MCYGVAIGRCASAFDNAATIAMMPMPYNAAASCYRDVADAILFVLFVLHDDGRFALSISSTGRVDVARAIRVEFCYLKGRRRAGNLR